MMFMSDSNRETGCVPSGLPASVTFSLDSSAHLHQNFETRLQSRYTRWTGSNGKCALETPQSDRNLILV